MNLGDVGFFLRGRLSRGVSRLVNRGGPPLTCVPLATALAAVGSPLALVPLLEGRTNPARETAVAAWLGARGVMRAAILRRGASGDRYGAGGRGVIAALLAGADGEQPAAILLHAAGARDDEQRLAKRMRVPMGARAGCKAHIGGIETRGRGRLEPRGCILDECVVQLLRPDVTASDIGEKVAGLGAAEFLRKPFQLDALIQRYDGGPVGLQSLAVVLGEDAGMVAMYVLLFLSATVRQFFDPAWESVLPEIASEDELSRANSFLAISSFGSTAVGFAAAGFLSTVNIHFPFYIDSATFLFSFLVVLLVRVPKMPPSDETTTVGVVVENLRSGASYLWKTPILRSSLLLTVPILMSFGFWNVMLLPMAIKVLGATEFEYGLQEGLTSVGFVVGALFMARYGDRLPEGTWIVAGSVTSGFPFRAGLDGKLWLSCVTVRLKTEKNGCDGSRRLRQCAFCPRSSQIVNGSPN